MFACWSLSLANWSEDLLEDQKSRAETKENSQSGCSGGMCRGEMGQSRVDGGIHNGELLSLAVRSIVFLILKLLSCRRFCIPGAFRLRLDRVHSDTTIHPTPHRPDLDNHTTMSSIWSSIFFLFLGFCICSQHPLSKMSDKALDWLQDKTLGWMDAPPTNKLDTHHHFVPPFYSKGESTPY